MVKVLIVSTMYPNSQIYKSGVFVHESVKELIKLGVSIQVVAPIPYSPLLLRNFSKKWGTYAKIPGFEIIEDVEVYHPRFIALPGGILKHYWAYILYYNVLRMLRKNVLVNPDIIHVQGSIPEDYAGYLLSRKTQKKFLLTVHGATVYFVTKNKRHFKKSKIALINANLVIAVSKIVKDKIRFLTGRDENIEVIYNGFTDTKIEDISESHNSTIKILFGATLVERKGCEILIKAFKNILVNNKQVLLEIAGGGALLNKLMDIVDEFGITDYVKFYGAVSHDRMLHLMKKSNIFVLPSWDEAFGVVYLEAMSFGKPVIGTIGEGISEIITHGENGLLVKARDVKDLEDKLNLLIENEEIREKIGKAGLLTVTNMTWKANAEKYKVLYEKIINENG